MAEQTPKRFLVYPGALMVPGADLFLGTPPPDFTIVSQYHQRVQLARAVVRIRL